VKSPTQLLTKLQSAGSCCRKRRQELSLLLVEPNVFDVHADPQAELAARKVRRAVGRACASLDQDSVSLIPLTPDRTAVVLCNCERRAAVAIAQNVIALLGPASSSAGEQSGDQSVTLSAGVATASAVPRNFEPANLLESAERCLHAARASGISAVKSIEV
jgi:GGDEF domain-containing protein